MGEGDAPAPETILGAMPDDGLTITRELTPHLPGDIEGSSSESDSSVCAIQILVETQPATSDPIPDGRASDEELEGALPGELSALLFSPGGLLEGRSLHLYYSTSWLEDNPISRYKGIWKRSESDLDELRSFRASEPVMFEMFHHQPYIRWDCTVELPMTSMQLLMRQIRRVPHFCFSRPLNWEATVETTRRIAAAAFLDGSWGPELNWRQLSSELASQGDILVKTGVFEIGHLYRGVHVAGGHARLKPAFERYIKWVERGGEG